MACRQGRKLFIYLQPTVVGKCQVIFTFAVPTTSTNSHLCMFVSVCNLRADDLSSDMCLQGLAVQSLHGDREQCDREEALKDFKESK